MQKYNSYRPRILIFLLVIISITAGAQFQNHPRPSSRVITSGTAEGDRENGNTSQDLFELLINEAKIFYVDAITAAFYKDTAEAKYCFDRLFEIVAEISELDGLTELQQDDFNRFYEKVSDDFQQNFSYLGSDTDATGGENLDEGLVYTSLDSVDLGADTLVVLEDKPGHIPLLRSRKIDRIAEFFAGRESQRFQYFLDNFAYYKDHIAPILKEYNLPEELIYLPLIESGYNPNAYSYAHAAGLWQFIAGTGARYGLRRNWWIDERRDPIKATHAAAKYLKKLYEEFDDWFLALAAYNAGELRIWRAIKREGTRDYFKLKSLPRQTRDYVPTFMAGMLIAKNPEKYGLNGNGKEKWEWEEVVVNRSYEFDDIARACGVDVNIIKRFNPELRRWVTPPNENNYVLRVPVGKGAALLENIEKLPEAPARQQTEWISHRVKKNETLSAIAKKYGTTVSAIVSANHIKKASQIRVGQVLVIPTDSYYKRPIEESATRHTVKKGETLSSIAARYKLSVATLRALNNLQDDTIIPGTVLKLKKSQKSEESTGNGSKITHIVKQGESLFSIAKKYSVSVNDIIKWNNLSKKTIFPRQKLIIYTSVG